MQLEALYLHHHCKKRGCRHKDLFQLYSLAAILFLFSRKRGGCRHKARGHKDGRHFVSFLESEEDADTWHCDGHHFVSFLESEDDADKRHFILII